MRVFAIGLMLLLPLSGCASLKVVPIQNSTGSVGKALEPDEPGVRFYRPALHVWITATTPSDKVNIATDEKTTTSPSTTDTTKKDSKKITEDKEEQTAETTAVDKTGSTTVQKTSTTVSTVRRTYSAQFVVLPDFSQEFVIQWKPGVGSVTPSFTLTDGWNLTAFASTVDSKASEFVSSLGALAGAGLLAADPAFKGPGLYRMEVDTAGRLSLGDLVISLD